MRYFYSLLILAFFSVNIVAGQTKISAEQVLVKASNNIANSKGTDVKFTIYNSGYSGTGVIKTLGNKFNITLPDVEVWYNGKDLYTYNKRAGETTIVIPTQEELAQTNPLSYVTGASKNYNTSFSTVKKPDRYVIEMLPKNRGDEIKRVTITLRSNNYNPEKIVVEPKSGSPITAEINSFKTGISVPADTFEYPKSKYSDVEIVDLR